MVAFAPPPSTGPNEAGPPWSAHDPLATASWRHGMSIWGHVVRSASARSAHIAITIGLRATIGALAGSSAAFVSQYGDGASQRASWNVPPAMLAAAAAGGIVATTTLR